MLKVRMEFNEKLQELRKAKSLTQEELAEALFVSRTAISKWESGRGYPSLDSLKEISKFFSVSIDDLICSEEIMTVAEDEKKEYIENHTAMICNISDIFLALLLFLPVFGNGAGNPASVSLFSLTGVNAWITIVFAVLIGVTVLNGLCGVVLSHFDKPVWNRHRLVTGIALSIADTAVFILTRQPYAGIICLAILVVKGLVIGKEKSTIFL